MKKNKTSSAGELWLRWIGLGIFLTMSSLIIYMYIHKQEIREEQIYQRMEYLNQKNHQ